MSERILTPRDCADAADIIATARSRNETLEIVGGGRCRDFGRPVRTASTLNLASLSGVLIYEPAELVMTARAATPLSEIETLLNGCGQHLAFEPPDLGPLWGRNAGGTLGGCLALGLGGPRRANAGAPRDHFLGFKAINGYGERFGAGGRVVKNVTGFDLPKLFAGSLGTLGVLTEVTVKVMPRPSFTRTLAISGLSDIAAIELLTRAANSAAQTTAGAHLPLAVAARSSVAFVSDSKRAVTALRLEGFQPSVESSERLLQGIVAAMRLEAIRIDTFESVRLWKEVGSAAVFSIDPQQPLWRLSVPPSRAARIAARIAGAAEAAYFYDAYGGVIWMQMADGVQERCVRDALMVDGSSDGHATLMRALPSARASASPFQPLAPALAALNLRVKQQFDPAGIFNPGRMYAEI